MERVMFKSSLVDTNKFTKIHRICDNWIFKKNVTTAFKWITIFSE